MTAPVADCPQSAFQHPALAFGGWALRALIPAGIVVFLLPFVALLFYSPPATDDFCKATLSFDAVPRSGVLAVTWLYYMKWSPRWLTTLLQSFVMSKVDLVSTYGWLLLVVMMATVLSLIYFFRTVLNFSRTRSVLAAAIFYAGWLAGSIQPATNVYWLTGVMEYQLPLCTLLLLIGLLHRYHNSGWQKVMLVLLSVAVPAQHEIGGAFVCAILISGFLVRWFYKRPAWHWCVSAGFAAASLAAVMLSPGNAARAAAEHKHLLDTAHAVWWIKHAFFYKGLDWILRPGILLAGCSIALVARRERKPGSSSDSPSTGFGLACLCALAVLLIEFAFVEMTMGAEAPGRVVGWFQFVFWLLLVCVIVAGVPELRLTPVSIGSTAGVFLLLALSLFGSANFRDAVADLRGPAQSWWRGNVARLAGRGPAVEFGDIRYPNIGQLTMRQPVTADSGCWVNRCVASYLHAGTVVARGATEACPQ